uniref:Uncharacterized protein n=1 Tax=Candidatus Kentrum sp. LPFa TaxID=2126335 RepID=A0A450WQL7_9GAMM|nr:MAG: hypothetical protein BECKLPF1236B_GA0070989_11693 [Candidatus Kentron sp. LPFa]
MTITKPNIDEMALEDLVALRLQVSDAIYPALSKRNVMKSMGQRSWNRLVLSNIDTGPTWKPSDPIGALTRLFLAPKIELGD